MALTGRGAPWDSCPVPLSKLLSALFPQPQFSRLSDPFSKEGQMEKLRHKTKSQTSLAPGFSESVSLGVGFTIVLSPVRSLQGVWEECLPEEEQLGLSHGRMLRRAVAIPR